MSTKANECLTTSRAYIKLIKLPMGCLSSRSTISPSDINESSSQNITTISNGKLTNNNNQAIINNNYRRQQQQKESNKSLAMDKRAADDAGGGENTTRKDEKDDGNNTKITSPIGNQVGVDVEHNNRKSESNINNINLTPVDKNGDLEMKSNDDNNNLVLAEEKAANNDNNKSVALVEEQKESNNNNNDSIIKKESSFDDETNIELLKQYVAIDYEITQLEERDTLMVYHEKIEQLEQLERELDMISAEAEEVAARSEGESQLDRIQSSSANGNNNNNNSMNNMKNPSNTGGENNSMNSSMSHKSWVDNQSKKTNGKLLVGQEMNNNSNTSSGINNKNTKKGPQETGSELVVANRANNNNNNNNNNDNSNNSPYSTVEEVFNRKIILEKERDKLKKEVELVIIECDKLQQRYKKRDEILDKLFDGRAGNGLENHLEQQLIWLLEQKHYVDQVFYSWKRAETLTSQTCEQFASAIELLKRMPQIQQSDQRDEIAKLIGNLLIKSRQDMEQAQKYNPNVDAPFFTDNETERFDKIIETISSNQISPSEYSQILTVIQFAYKRAVSIRLWLEQILQTTIARDSFELAEEYKWIAIQLRKERINLIKLKLQDEPYRSMAQAVLEEIVRQQTIADRRQQQEINRDSGVESETNDMDIEEEIYRLLELHKARLEDSINVATTSAAGANSIMNQQQLKVSQQQNLSSSSSYDSQRNEFMRDRIEKRMQGQVATTTSSILQQQADISSTPLSSGIDSANSTNKSANSITSIGTPTKLRIELDEVARQNLLKQVDQIHNKHKSRIDRLRGSNKAKANNFIKSRLQEVRQQVSKSNNSPNENNTDMVAAAFGLI